MKKFFFALSLLMLLTSVSNAGPSSLAKAEESTKETIPGYITNSLIDSNNTVDESYDNEGSSKGTLIDDKFGQVEDTAFDVTEVSTVLLDVLNENSNESFGTTIIGTSPYQLTDSYMQNTFYSYYINDFVRTSTFPNNHVKVAKTFATFKLQCNYFINDWTSEEQPIEFIINNNYPELISFCKDYLDKSVEIPLIRINGQTICNLNYNAENKSASISGINARVYPGIDSEGNLSGKLYCEIPFTEFIETLEITGNYHRDFDLKREKVFIKRCIINKTLNGGQVVTSVKTSTSLRDYPLLDPIKEAYNDFIQDKSIQVKEDEFVFSSNRKGKVIGETSIKREQVRICNLINLRVIKLHEFRHSCATYLFNKGVEIEVVSSWLGHSDMMTTLRVYAHLLPNRKDRLKNLF